MVPIVDILNTRELAIIVWASVLGGLLITHNKIRPALINLIKTAFNAKIITVFSGAIAYTIVMIALLKAFNFWTLSELKTSVLWVFTFAFVTMTEAITSKDKGKKLGTVARDVVTVTAFILFVAEFYTFPLWSELLLVPLTVFLGGLLAVADHDQKFAPIKRIIETLFVLIGLSMLAYSVIMIVNNPEEVWTIATLRSFAVPIIMSLAFIPFLYALILFVVYETALATLTIQGHSKPMIRYAVLRGMAVLGGNVDLLDRFRMSLNLEQELTHAAIDQRLKELWQTHQRRKNPPLVTIDKGWSPFEACKFLSQYGLKAENYRRLYEDWWTEVGPKEVGMGIMPGSLMYRLYGTEHAVTKLKLEFHVTNHGDLETGQSAFEEAAITLLKAAMGQPTAAQFIFGEPFEFKGKFASARYTIDDHHGERFSDYRRELIIEHQQHIDLFARTPKSQ